MIGALAAYIRSTDASDATRYSFTPFTALGVAISLFLGFRNNACYERWWEARKHWGMQYIVVKQFVRLLHSLPLTECEHQKFVRLAMAHTHAMRAQLRATWRNGRGRAAVTGHHTDTFGRDAAASPMPASNPRMPHPSGPDGDEAVPENAGIAGLEFAGMFEESEGRSGSDRAGTVEQSICSLVPASDSSEPSVWGSVEATAARRPCVVSPTLVPGRMCMLACMQSQMHTQGCAWMHARMYAYIHTHTRVHPSIHPCSLSLTHTHAYIH